MNNFLKIALAQLVRSFSLLLNIQYVNSVVSLFGSSEYEDTVLSLFLSSLNSAILAFHIQNILNVFYAASSSFHSQLHTHLSFCVSSIAKHGCYQQQNEKPTSNIQIIMSVMKFW